MHYDFIEIGTSNFDTEIQECDDETAGLSIEPLQHYLDDLPNKPNVRKVCAAMSSHDGYTDIYHVSPDDIKKYNLNMGVAGCNTINAPHAGLKKWIQNYEKIVKTTKVRVITWETLIKEYSVSSIGYIKIDTEGHDAMIISCYLDICEKMPSLLADKIVFESNILSDKKLEEANLLRMQSLGYEMQRIKNRWNEYDCHLQLKK
jgi:FkbM family methyltransferase